MLVKLQFDGATYDVIDVPKFLMDDWYVKRKNFDSCLYTWLKKQGHYKNDGYSYARDEVIEWLNTEVLKNSDEKVKIVASDKFGSGDDDLPLMFF